MAAAAQRARVQPPVVRNDPSPRHFNGVPQLELVNKDPRRVYKLVSNESKFTGPDYYQWQGWEPEVCRKDGVRFKYMNVSREGEQIRFWDMVLMSIDASKHAEMEAEGQRLADEREDQIIDKTKGGLDPLRGIGTQFLVLKNQIEAPEIEQ